MFKSKLFIKAMFIVFNMILLFTLAIYYFVIPKVENNVRHLEVKHAKVVLKKVVLLVKNSKKNLDDFEKHTYKQNKIELKNLTDSIYSLIENFYEQSKQENIISSLKKKAEEFNENINNFYLKYKNTLSKEELKKGLINYINIYRYNDGTGYFVLSDLEHNVLVHPVLPSLSNTNREHSKILRSLTKQVKETGVGSFKYKWLNPKSKKIEDKISYSFVFEPYNWMLTTGEYYNVLKMRLQQDVFNLVTKIRYSNNSYFFISNYKNVMLSHPYYQGRDFTNLLDKEGTAFLPTLTEKTRKEGESFNSYYWSKDNTYANPLRKFTYSRDFPQWKIIISTGFYIDQIQKELKIRKAAVNKQLEQIIKDTKMGKTGYLFIFNGKGEMLIHPNTLKGHKKAGYKMTPRIFNALVKASLKKDNVYAYKWDKQEDKNNFIYDKETWVEYIPQLDWYIASSVYIDEFKTSANEVKNYIFQITFVVLLLSLLYSVIFFRSLLKPISLLSALAINVSKGNYKARSTDTTRKDEIGILSNKFNDMLNTIEDKNSELKDKNILLEDSNHELEEMIQNVKKTQDKLIESEKMASLAGLVAGVAHEINTPVGIGLTAITHLGDTSKDISKAYKNETMSQDDFEDYLKTSQELSSLIEHNLSKTAKLVRSFKQIAADQSEDEKKEFNLKEYCDEVLISINSIVKQTSLTLTMSCEENIVINSYPGAFSHIISNLTSNSIKHGFDEKEQGQMHFDIKLKETHIQILYNDNGKGIPKENYQKVFDPFFTTNRKDGGTGLGLNIIYNVVQKSLKGNITCEPCEKGVLFKIILPL